MTLMAAMLALGNPGWLVRPLGKRLLLRGVVAFLAAQSALLYGYAMCGGGEGGVWGGAVGGGLRWVAGGRICR